MIKDIQTDNNNNNNDNNNNNNNNNDKRTQKVEQKSYNGLAVRLVA